MTTPHRVDVHQHLLPPAYRELMDRHEMTAGGWPTPSWDARSALAMMDRRSIATGVLSISAPGTHFGDDSEARATARDVNEFGAEPAKDRPDRSGFFAGVPLPDTILYGSDFPLRTRGERPGPRRLRRLRTRPARRDRPRERAAALHETVRRRGRAGGGVSGVRRGRTPVGRIIVDKLEQFRLGARSLARSENTVPASSGAGIPGD